MKNNKVLLLSTALKQELGLVVTNIRPLNPGDLGDSAEVFSGVHDCQKIFIKLQATSESLRIESLALGLLRERGISCPEVLGFIDNVKSLGLALLTDTALGGTPLSREEDATKKLAACKAAGKMLKKIHEIKLEGFGSLKFHNNKLSGSLKTWRENVEHFRPDFEYLNEQGYINDKEFKKLVDAHEATASVFLPQASLIHGDYSPQHIYTANGAITGIIDLGVCRAGDPRKDIATMHFFLSPDEAKIFDSGYGSLANDPMMTRYDLLQAAVKVEYRAKKGFADRLPAALEALKNNLSA